MKTSNVNTVANTVISFSTESGISYDVNVKSSLLGTTDAFSDNGSLVYKYRINLNVDGNKAWFVYHTSINDYNNRKNNMDEKDLQFAVFCFLSDACSGDSSFENFCGELGYDEDSRKAHKIYLACVRSCESAKRLFSDIYEAANALNELDNA